MAQAPRDVTILKLRVLNIKKNTKPGILNNSYVLADRTNKAVREYFIYFIRFARRNKKSRQNKKKFLNI